MAGSKDNSQDWEALRRRIIGLGERSIHKSYYPQLQQRFEELRRSRALLDGSSEGIFLLRPPEARLVDVNESACLQLGYTCPELLKLTFFDLFRPQDVPRVREIWETLENNVQGRSIRFKLLRSEFLCSDNTGFPVNISMRCVVFDTEKYVVAVARDITERLRMESDLLRIQKLESLGIFAGGIAHDFNNCLTAVMNQISLAKMRLEDPQEALGRLILAEKACLQAKDLTQQLLTFAKGGDPVRRTISIAGLIADALQLVLAGANVKPVLSVPDDLWPVNVDPGQISQVLHNVLINAVQAMPGGGVVRVSARNVPAGAEDLPLMPVKDHVCLNIEDNGPGVSQEHLPRIFDPYFTTKPSGRGLGLAASHSIIRKHEGLIHVETQEGVGTVFTICLPAAEETADDEWPADASSGAGDRAARILFMDDEKMIRESMEEILKGLGYCATTVRDGREAVEALRKAVEESRSFDVAIMDLTVSGGMGGALAVRELKAIDPRIRAVVSSGYAMAPAMARHVEHGFDAVLPKPYAVAELHQVLQRLLGEGTKG